MFVPKVISSDFIVGILICYVMIFDAIAFHNSSNFCYKSGIVLSYLLGILSKHNSVGYGILSWHHCVVLFKVQILYFDLNNRSGVRTVLLNIAKADRHFF